MMIERKTERKARREGDDSESGRKRREKKIGRKRNRDKEEV